MAVAYQRFIVKNAKKIRTLPNIAVCLAAFNGVRWLPEQLNSILGQMNVSVTVIVSVDRSTDGTERWFDQRALVDNRVILLQHDEQFGGAAPNFFRIMREVDFSTYDYVSLSDQDDVWLPNKLSRACEVLSRTGVDAYSSNVVAFWPDGRKSLIKKSQPQVRWDFLFEAAGPGCTFVMKTNLVDAIQSFLKTRLSEVQKVGHGQHDWFIYAFARAKGYHWVIDDYAGMLYRQHQKNQVGVNIGWRAFVYRARMVFSGWGLTQSALIAGLVGLNHEPFVTRWSDGSRAGMLWLALHARQCRRRTRDQLFFSVACATLSIVGHRSQ